MRSQYVNWIAVLLLASLSAHAGARQLLEQGFVAKCTEPHGPSLEYGWLYRVDGKVLESPDDGFQEGSDGFSNMNPVFLFRADGSGRLLSIWGDTRPEGVSEDVLDSFAETSVDKNIVIAITDEMISAVGRVGNEVWLTSLMPSLGIGYFSYHQVDNPAAGTLGAPEGAPVASARSSALSAECEFSRLKQ